MKLDEKRKFLLRYKNNNKMIIRLYSKIQKIDDRMKSIKSPSLSNERSGKSYDITELIANKMELEKRISRLQEKQAQIKQEILTVIDTLDNPIYADVLEDYYVNLETFENIAIKLDYTERHIMRLHKQALERLNFKKMSVMCH